jgi:hypothetical protein
MRYIIVYLLIISTLGFCSTQSRAEDWQNGDAKFDFTRRKTNSVQITIQTVDNVQKACEAESKRRGLGGFGYSVDACSFWSHGPSGSTCEIYLPNRTSMHDIGHEVRHCYVGSFH